MRRKSFWIIPLVLLLLILGPCAFRSCFIVTPKPPKRGSFEAACANWRWIGVLPQGGACPVAQGPGWTSRPLFAPAAVSLPPQLAAFCLYEHTGLSLPGTRPTFAPGSPPIQLGRDFASVTLQGDTSAKGSPKGDDLELAVGPALESHFLAQAGARVLVRSPDLPRTRLAFLDTQPNGEGMPTASGSSGHGYSLARAASRLACGDTGVPGALLDPTTGAAGVPGSAEQCAVNITTRLALPIVSFNPDDRTTTAIDPDHGGFFGSVAGLALAIVDEVDAWKAVGDDSNLVLNLSLGWDGDLFGGGEATVGAMPPPVQAVYQALQYASGEGALVVAAAGNRVAGPRQGKGPLYPAAWEKVTTRSGDPLVYAAGGVQTGGEPLSNARPGAIPARVAYADHAVVATEPSEPSASMLTGSSVAAAVISTTAAAVWHYRPDLLRGEVIKLLEESGDRLVRRDKPVDLRQADFWNDQLEKSAPQVRRISLCRAVACALGGASCGDSAKVCAPWNPQVPALAPLLSPVAAKADVDVSGWTPSSGGMGSACAGRDLRYTQKASRSSDPCPSMLFTEPRGEPWTNPQPSDAPCPSCVMAPQPPPGGDNKSANPSATLYTLKVRIREDWEGPDCLVLATLDIDRRDGSPPVSYVISQPICKKKGVVELKSIGDGISLAGAAVTLSFKVPETSSTSTQAILNEVFVVP